MIGYLKVLVPLAALAILAFRFQLLRFPLQPSVPASTVAASESRVDTAVQTVRAGFLPGFDATSVGQAFERRFRNPQWNSFQTPSGATIVNFRGTIVAKALDDAGLDASHANPIIIRSNCIRSLGLNAATEQKASSAREAEQTYRSTLAETQEQRLNGPAGTGSQTPSKEYLSAVSARKQKEKADRDLDTENEAKIQSCIADFPIVVNFQFALSADLKKFEVAYIDKEPFGAAAPSAVLAFVYR